MRLRLTAIIAVIVLTALAASALLRDGDQRPSAVGADRPAPRTTPPEPTATTPRERPRPVRPPDPYARIDDPFAYDPGREAAFVRRATAGFQHPLYSVVPGGPVATAERVNRWRPLIDRAAEAGDVEAGTLEAMVYLESAGFPEARAGDTEGAVGLTQILAETGQSLLGMRIDVARSARLTRRITRADRRGRERTARRLRAQRRRVDERYDPRKALAGAVRYLEFARGELGGDEEAAVVAYHMGVGNLQTVRRRFGADEDTPYAEIYFDSSPLRHAAAFRTLASFGDDSSTYLWRVLAARDVMRRWRADPGALAVRAARIAAKNSTEELLRRIEDTPKFANPGQVRAAYREGDLEPLSARDLAGAGVRIDKDMGELARRLKQPRTLYRGLRPEALALLVYLARGTEAIGDDQPLVLTSTVRDERYQAQLLRRNVQATPGYSLHTTGYAFDVLRRYRSRRQALAFQFMLDRLQALNVVAWVREPAAIHITAGPEAERLLGLLSR